MRVAIIGATGFIGKSLVKELLDHGHIPVAVSRDAVKARKILGNKVEIFSWNGISPEDLVPVMEVSDAMINLAGKSLASGRWTKRNKKQIIDSRIRTGNLLTEAIGMATNKPALLIQASAIGFYGTLQELPADESFPAGTGFGADLTNRWEISIKPVQEMIPRVAWLRTGLVLGRNGGLLQRIMLPFRFYAGTIIGPGDQWMSWIHINDHVRAIRFILENEKASGPYNLSGIQPVRMKEMIQTIGKITGRPVWVKVPAWALQIIFGEMANETILTSLNIYPEKLLRQGFRFKYTNLEPALENLLKG